jgi:cytochrome c oxidase subunit 3
MMNKNRILMLAFVGSEAFFFLALIIAYVYYSRIGGTLAASSRYLDLARTSLFTVFLVSSSFTIMAAESVLRRGKTKAVLLWLAVTMALGAVFLVGQASEYARLIGLDVTISGNVFGSAFFTLTGFHGLHVFIGLIVLAIVFAMIASGKFTSIRRTTFESAAIYWHFVDVVWIFVFLTVYIGPYV